MQLPRWVPDLPDLAYQAGEAIGSPPRHLDYSREEGRSHFHLVGDEWEVRVSWHRVDD